MFIPELGRVVRTSDVVFASRGQPRGPMGTEPAGEQRVQIGSLGPSLDGRPNPILDLAGESSRGDTSITAEPRGM